MSDTVTVTLESDGDTDELTLPSALLERLRAEDEPDATVVGDMAMLALAQQAHGLVHHSHGNVSEELKAAEKQTLDLFEERFGRSFAEMTGHSH